MKKLFKGEASYRKSKNGIYYNIKMDNILADDILDAERQFRKELEEDDRIVSYTIDDLILDEEMTNIWIKKGFITENK